MSSRSFMVERDQWDTYWGPKKKISSIRGTGRHDGRPGGILSIRDPEVPLGSPRVDAGRAQTPTPRGRPLPSADTKRQGAWQRAALQYKSPKFGIQSSGETQALAHAA